MFRRTLYSIMVACARLRQVALVLLLGTGCLLLLALAPLADAKAPPHATTTVETGVFATPDWSGYQIGSVDAGTELELTGVAAPGFLGVIYGDSEGWIPSMHLSTGTRPGIGDATAIMETVLTDAPLRDSGIVSYIPEGESVILTGAIVDGYYAASYNGLGGWVNGRDFVR